MKLINNRQELELICPYKKSKPTYHPKEYPCLVEYEYIANGLGGGYYGLNVIYIPDNIDINSFIEGVNTNKFCIGNE